MQTDVISNKLPLSSRKNNCKMSFTFDATLHFPDKYYKHRIEFALLLSLAFNLVCRDGPES